MEITVSTFIRFNKAESAGIVTTSVLSALLMLLLEIDTGEAGSTGEGELQLAAQSRQTPRIENNKYLTIGPPFPLRLQFDRDFGRNLHALHYKFASCRYKPSAHPEIQPP